MQAFLRVLYGAVPYDYIFRDVDFKTTYLNLQKCFNFVVVKILSQKEIDFIFKMVYNR